MRYTIKVSGIVQGVGFRPFIKRLADRMSLPGTVRNTSGGVVIEIEPPSREQIDVFLAALKAQAPSLSRIESCEAEAVDSTRALSAFQILPSEFATGDFTLVAPDVAICSECLREIQDPADRRYRYPFTNCTNCGPRYSIIRRLPYDRCNTTMQAFRMCEPCAKEYHDPSNRRFHAEPIACPSCGPKLHLPGSDDALAAVIASLKSGQIVAVRGLGGFQLACDAQSAVAVERMRQRKRRSRKPFAVMMRDLESVREYCHLSSDEARLLQDQTGPIVLLRMREPRKLPAGAAPGLDELGVLLPNTPLHHLLFEPPLQCLVMTSGNMSEEPIVIANRDACSRLSAVADRILEHDRDIFMRVDDSVVRWNAGAARVLRRARGYVPGAIDLGREVVPLMGCGAEMKNTFCLIKGHYAILSQHIGDLENFETLQFFEETFENLKALYSVQPKAIAHDLHPDYLSTQWALRQPLARVAVQHHHAHIASCMAENRLKGPVIGVAFDGTGYGTDGQIWGGEFLVCGYRSFRRVAHLRYVPLIGGEKAIRDGSRMAAAFLYDAFGPDYRKLSIPSQVRNLPAVLDQILARPKLWTSSCGRLFDAVASLAGICHASSYEGEAAMLLEAAATEGSGSYRFAIAPNGEIDTRLLIRDIVHDVERGCAPGSIAARFHHTLSAMIEMVCKRLRDETGIEQVCFSGGTFQNCRLAGGALAMLENSGFQVFMHSQVPPNDGGLSLGQAVIAAAWLESEEES